jgi:hypothetical protein
MARRIWLLQLLSLAMAAWFVAKGGTLGLQSCMPHLVAIWFDYSGGLTGLELVEPTVPLARKHRWRTMRSDEEYRSCRCHYFCAPCFVLLLICVNLRNLRISEINTRDAVH